MSREILGYTKEGEPIYPIKPGMIATAAIISCVECTPMDIREAAKCRKS